MGVLVFALFTVQFFLGAVTVEAASCPTGSNITISTDCTWEPGTHVYTGTLTINSDVTVTAGNATTPGLVTVQAETVVIEGTISADGLGMPQDVGTGATTGVGGGGYGGRGGRAGAGGVTYGSVTQPDDIGSGGYYNAGGGAVKLVASGALTLNGTITAIGGNVSSNPGGSGGSVWVDGGSLFGTGTISVDGGDGHYASGGGGRAAVYWTGGSKPGWTVTAYGGDTSNPNYERGDGGAGTVFYDDKDDGDANGELVVTNNPGALDPNYTDQVTTASQTYDDITVSQGSHYRIPNGFSLTLSSSGGFTVGGSQRPVLAVSAGGTFTPTGYTTWTFNNIDFDQDGALAVVTDLTFSNSDYELNTETATFSAGDLDTLTVQSTASMTVEGDETISLGDLVMAGVMTHADNSTAREHVIDVSAATIDIQATSTVDVDGMGFDGDTGTGAHTGGDGGGGYGGRGGEATFGGITYGSVTQPDDIGSGGYFDNTGGGAVKLVASGALTLNGTITARGDSVSSNPGGSGGSVWIDGSSLFGTGTISVDGGDGFYASGGGGRAAVHWTGGSKPGWTVTAYGGDTSSFNYERGDGGAGTIFYDDKDDGDANGELVVTNNPGAVDPNYTDQVTTASQTYDDITVSRGSHYRVPNGFSLTLTSGGLLTTTGSPESRIEIDSGASATLPPSNTYDDCAVINNGTLNLGPTITVQDADWVNTGTVSGVITLTCSGGTCTNDGSLDGGVTTLTVNSGGNWIQNSTDTLFSGSDLIVDGGTFTQGHTNVIGVTNVQVINGGLITHTDNSTARDAVVYLSASGNFTIDDTSSVEVSTLGYDSENGTGAGESNIDSAGGAGYGGDGGDGTTGALGGSAWGDPDIATEIEQPDELGSGGGRDTGSTSFDHDGGDGGGAIRLVVTGTLTVDGEIHSDGESIAVNDGGGGSGGSIWVDAGTITCGGSSSITANGGDSADGGGGGGGRISMVYSVSYTGCSPTANDGTGAVNGSEGTVEETLQSPAIASFTLNPPDPGTNDPILASLSASYVNGIDSIAYYLDGSPPATGLIHTCSFSGSPTTADCEYILDPLEHGDHTVTAIVTGSDASTSQQGIAVTSSGTTTYNTVHLDRLKAGLTNIHFTMDFQLSGTVSGTLQVNFPAGFTVTSVALATGTCQGGTLTSFDIATGAQSFTVTQNACTPGATHIEGVYVDLPTNVDTYEVTWSNDRGFGALAIMDDDQVMVTSNVDPSISFNVGTAATGSPCDHTFTGNGGVVALGTLTAGAIAGSDTGSTQHICTRMSHNATSGAVITVRSQYAALRSQSTPADTVPAVGTTLSAGTEGYGLCLGSDGSHYGKDPAWAAAADPDFTGSDFSTGACTSSTHQVGLMTTSDKLFWSTAGPTVNAFARSFLKAAISVLTEAHDDYTDTLTFIMTATY